MKSPPARAWPRRLLLILFLAGSAGTTYWLGWQREAPGQRYQQQKIELGSITQTVSANGTLNPVTLVNVGTQVSGTVKRLLVDFNDQVEAGQVLAVLDDAIYSAQVRQSDASVSSAQATLDLARSNAERNERLFAEEYISRQEVDQARQALRAADAQLRLARAQNDRDRANLGYSVIRSPVSGVVVDRQIDVGQTVAASFQTPTLFKIAQDLRQMQIYTSFAEADIGNIRVGQAVRFNVDAFPNRSFRGEVRQLRLNPITTQNVVTYNVVVAFDNAEQLLLPGMTAYVNIATQKKDDALLVPNAALRFKPSEAKREGDKGDKGGKPPKRDAGPGGGKPREGKDSRESQGTVYRLDATDGRSLKAVSIGIGISNGRLTEVTSGELQAGDEVVTGEALPTKESSGSGNLRFKLF